MRGRTGFINRYLTEQPKRTKPTLTKDNSFLVFPFELTMGYITSTENGIRQNDSVNVYDYSTFQRVFTGLENVLAQWENAYKVEKVNDTDTFLTKTYQVGRSFRAAINQETLGATFEASTISSDFLAEFTDEEFTLHTYEELSEADLFKLYIIPGLKEFKWLYVSNAVKYYNRDKTLDHVEITLTTLNNKIAKSGRAIEEFVQRSAPGEGYAFPVVDQDQNVSLDLIRNRDVPITSMQVEMAGAAAIGTIYAYGRPTIQEKVNGITQSTFNPKIEAPRLLLPLRMETAIPSPTNTRPTAETDWLVGNFKPTLADDYADWTEQFTGNYDLTQRANYEGFLKGIDGDDIVDKTNPVQDGTRDHLLWDTAWTFEGTHKYNTSTDALSTDELDLNKTLSMPELLAHNVFGLSAFSALPLSLEQNVSWSLKDIPIIGGFLSKLTFGIPLGWVNTAVKVKCEGLLLTIPASLRDYANVLVKQNQDKDLRIALETLTDEAAKNDAIEFSGIKATGSIFKVRLTDRFTKTIDGVDYTFNTVDLGQDHPTVDDEGVAIANNNEPKLVWDASCKPANPSATTPGYVIDTSTFKALGKQDYRLTFFTNNIQAWSGTYQTQSKFTGSIRDWTNAIKMSNWKEDSNQQVDYPAVVVAPTPPGVNNPQIPLTTYNELLRRPNGTLLTVEVNPTSSTTTDLLVFTSQPIKSTKVIDLSQNLGGATAFRNNYETIRISFTDGTNSQNIDVDVNTLFNQSTLTATINRLNSRVQTTYVRAGTFIPNRIFNVVYDYGKNAVFTISGDNLTISIDDIELTTTRSVLDTLTSQNNNRKRIVINEWKLLHDNLPENAAVSITITAIPKQITQP